MKYKVVHEDSINGKKHRRELLVDGRKISIAGFEEFRFFSHKAVSEWQPSFGGFVCISEFTTGAFVAREFTLQSAKQKALANLNSVGVDGFRKMINDIIRKLGGEVNSEQKVNRSVATTAQ